MVLSSANYFKNRRLKAINILGGIVCRGLSFINGPDCPVPPSLLTLDDINISHRKSVGNSKGQRRADEVFAMRKPELKFILLCTLCNQRMRHIAKEFRTIKLPKKVISLYKKSWSLEEIAEEYDCSYQVVSNYLKANNIKIRKGFGGLRAWESRRGGFSAWAQSRDVLLKERRTRHNTPERIKLAKQIHKMWDDGDCTREIAQWFGISKGAVLAHLNLVVEA